MTPVSDDANVSGVYDWHYRMLSERVIESLNKKNIQAEYAANRVEGLAKLIDAIPAGASIGIGDSVTLFQIGFHDWLEKQQDREIYNGFIRDANGKFVHSPKEHFDVLQKALVSDVYITSTNAITLDGIIVSLDGRGNRVAAMVWGPKQVIIVTGANKIVKDLDEAMDRQKIAASMNAYRHMTLHGSTHHSKRPCVIKGVCNDCKTPDRMCRKTVIIDGQNVPKPEFEELGISVILIGESLGF